MTAQSDDATLVRDALAGNEQAQRALVAQHRDTVYRITRTATGDADEAFDIAQDVFIAVFGALRRYDPARPFRSWITSVTLNKCRDWSRRRTVRRFLLMPLSEGTESWISNEAALPEEIAAGRAELATVSGAIILLPSKLKDVLLLQTVEGLSQAVTAVTLGISEKAVETRLYRARAKLSEILRGVGMARV